MKEILNAQIEIFGLLNKERVEGLIKAMVKDPIIPNPLSVDRKWQSEFPKNETELQPPWYAEHLLEHGLNGKGVLAYDDEQINESFSTPFANVEAFCESAGLPFIIDYQFEENSFNDNERVLFDPKRSDKIEYCYKSVPLNQDGEPYILMGDIKEVVSRAKNESSSEHEALKKIDDWLDLVDADLSPEQRKMSLTPEAINYLEDLKAQKLEDEHDGPRF